MSERLTNLWGKEGCGTANGRCKACCFALGVEEIKKPENSDCPLETETGCKIYGLHPSSCENYYCGKDTNMNRKKWLIHVAELKGYVTSQEAEEAREKL